MPIWLKTLLFTLLVPGTATVGVPYLLLAHGPSWLSFDLGPIRYSAVALIVVGAMGYLSCAWEFTFTGGGTPAPLDPPKVFVATGLYRIVRNPMYVSVLMILLGEALRFGSVALLAYALVFWGCAHLFVLYYEEPTLKKKFGLSYENYLLAIPRWLPKTSPGSRLRA